MTGLKNLPCGSYRSAKEIETYPSFQLTSGVLVIETTNIYNNGGYKMDFEAKELRRYQPFLVDEKMKEILATPDGELYSCYLVEEDALKRRINNENGFRGQIANRQRRLKRLQEELLPRQRDKVLLLLTRK